MGTGPFLGEGKGGPGVLNRARGRGEGEGEAAA
jgi:hypothetical protein